MLTGGKWDEARIELAGVRGESGGPAFASAAWEGIAEVHERRGESVEAVRALLKARDLADARAKGRLAPRLEAALGALTPEQRTALARTSAGAGLVRETAARAEVRVTLLSPISGRFENFGRAFRLGAQIALDERAARAPAIELLVADTAGDAVKSVLAAREAVAEHGAAALMGPLLSVPTIACAAVAEAQRVALVTPAIAESRLGEIGSAVHVLVSSPRETARVLAEAAVAELGLRRIAVLTPGDSISGARAEALAAEARARGGTVVATIPYTSGAKEFRAPLAAVRKSDSDAVYILGEAADLEVLAGQLDGASLGRRILGNGEWGDAKLRRFASRSLEGAVFALEAGEASESAFSLALAEKVRARSGEELSRFHVFGFEAMDEVIAAIDRGARDADEILEMLRSRAAWDEPPAGRTLAAWTVHDGSLRLLGTP